MKLNTNNTVLRISAGRPDQFPRDPFPQVALAGRSNVGKSSLINTLLGRKSLARVSATPGKTVTVNFYEIDRKLFLVDLPGYGFARRAAAERDVWAALTDGYFTKNPNLDLLRLVIQLADIRVGLTDEDRDMLGFLAQAGLPHIVVATKTDKLSKTALAAALADLRTELREEVPVIPFSAQTRAGTDEVWSAIFNRCGL